MYALTTITAPASEPVTLAVAKAHLRIDHDAEDALITGWIKAARELTESYTGRRWVEQELRLTLAAFECDGDGRIRLPVEPVTSIDLVSYTAESGATVELAEGDGYQTWLEHSPPLVAPPPYESWPATKGGAIKPVAIEFTAGYATEAVPEQVKTAILLTLGDWDKNRAGEGSDPRGRGLPPAARCLLDSLWTGAY